MAHHCHATKCKTEVPPVMFMCRRHWFMVPLPIRNEIWATYRRGQCDDMNPSDNYCVAAKKGVEAVAKREGLEPDTSLYDLFLGGRR